MAIKTQPFDASEYFQDTESQAWLLADALHEGDLGYIIAVLGVVAKARGITRLATETGLSRQALHRSLGKGGNPTLATVVKVVNALGMQLDVKVGGAEGEPARHPELALTASAGLA